jgi:hypothetical protein
MRTKNIKFCAYLKLFSINPVEVKKLDKGKAEYIYSLSEDEWERWQIKFNNSEFLAYANNLEAIKDLAY